MKLSFLFVLTSSVLGLVSTATATTIGLPDPSTGVLVGLGLVLACVRRRMNRRKLA